MAILQKDKSGLWAQQDEGSFLEYSIDWSDAPWILSGDTIASSVWQSDVALTLNSGAINGASTSIWVQGGVANKWYAVTNIVTSEQGQRDQRTIRLLITDEDVGVVDGTAVFPNRKAAIDELIRDQLMVAGQNHLPDIQLNDDYIFDKLKAAEAFVQKSVRCYLAPTVIVPDDAPQSEIDALDAAKTRYAQEAAYDYESNFFTAEKWGYIVTQQKPIVSVESIKFVYPSPVGQIFQIPAEWIRLDRKYGHIRIVPTAISASIPMASYIMQAISGGMSVPFMIQVRYTAGIKDIHNQYPDLVSAIKRMAVMDILKDSFMPQSGSISADGLSQSISADMDKYLDSANKTIATIRDEIQGIRFAVF